MKTFNLLSSSALEAAINKVCRLDPELESKIEPLINKVIAIELTDWKLSYFFYFEALADDATQAITIQSESSDKPNVKLSGSSFAFFNMASQERGGDSIFKGEVIFEGEVSTAQAFQNFWLNLELDWEEELSKYTGDVVAHQLNTFAKTAQSKLAQFWQTSKLNASEYVKEELRLTPAPEEAETFYDAVDELRSDVNRLAAKLEQIKNKIDKSAS
ncbi:MAG: SCP2 sterol-binding domain-containing protein [Gammaproteobacteria bacterium]|nr:SCP2 sterol-binding domain-containing protein [Gammaproteobacteria bacterium]